jgi:hypothetical protein
MIVRTFFKESDGANIKAEIHDTPEGYAIYYYTSGEFMKSETYHDKSIHYVESAAENWIAGIKVLNG